MPMVANRNQQENPGSHGNPFINVGRGGEKKKKKKRKKKKGKKKHHTP